MNLRQHASELAVQARDPLYRRGRGGTIVLEGVSDAVARGEYAQCSRGRVVAAHPCIEDGGVLRKGFAMFVHG
jgi:hypothetical protein